MHHASRRPTSSARVGRQMKAREHLGAREAALAPCERAVWSGKASDEQRRDWLAQHKKLSHELTAFWHDGSRRLICIGDSITERLRLTRGGMPLSKLPVRAIESAGLVGVHELVRTHSLMRRWGAPLLLGIGGDQTQHLLWRLANGETLLHGNGSITQKMMRRGPSVPLFSLLIGTNNLGWGMSPTETANGILGVAEHCLSHHSSARLLVTELLPRATLTPWPPDDLGGKSQQEVAMDLVRSTNSLVRRGLLHGGRFAAYRSSRRLAVADCGAHFQVAVQSWMARAKNDKGKLEFDRNTSLLPDGLHPSTAGYQLLLGCWERHLAALEAEKEEMR